jgi:hypothetical protein
MRGRVGRGLRRRHPTRADLPLQGRCSLVGAATCGRFYTAFTFLRQRGEKPRTIWYLRTGGECIWVVCGITDEVVHASSFSFVVGWRSYRNSVRGIAARYTSFGPRGRCRQRLLSRHDRDPHQRRAALLLRRFRPCDPLPGRGRPRRHAVGGHLTYRRQISLSRLVAAGQHQEGLLQTATRFLAGRRRIPWAWPP